MVPDITQRRYHFTFSTVKVKILKRFLKKLAHDVENMSLFSEYVPVQFYKVKHIDIVNRTTGDIGR